MINITTINQLGNNKNGDCAIDYLLSTPEISAYYVGQKDIDLTTSRWYGQGAAQFGLLGTEVDRDRMKNLSEGYNPDRSEALCQNAGEPPRMEPKIDRKTGLQRLNHDGTPMTVMKGGHRHGYDITFSAPREISTLFALAKTPEQRGEHLRAHQTAVEAAMRVFEDWAETRRGKGGKEVHRMPGVVAALFDQITNRNMHEPHLHTHGFVFAVGMGDDSKWGKVEPREWFRVRHMADQVYKAALYEEHQKLGFGLQQVIKRDLDGNDTHVRTVQIAGLPQELVEHFSQRRQQLIDYAKEHNVDMKTAWKQTRENKDEPETHELFQRWADEAKALGMDIDLDRIKGLGNEFVDAPSDEDMLKRMHEHDAILTEPVMTVAIADAYQGQLNVTQLHSKVHEFKSSMGLLEVEAEWLHEDDKGFHLSRRHTEKRYTASWMHDTEQFIINCAKERENELDVRIDPMVVEQNIQAFQLKKGFTLSDEQRKAAFYVASETGGTAVLSGLAGTGKTTVSEIFKNAFESQGRIMLGAAVSKKAANKLQEESGIKSSSLSKLLSDAERNKITLTDKHVIVLDESGMTDSKDTARLMLLCQRSGSKLVAMGDSEQIQPVGAGSGMSLAKSAIGDTKLTEIRRQKRPETLQAVKNHYDYDEDMQNIDNDGRKSMAHQRQKAKEAYEHMEAHGMVEEFDNRKQKLKAIVDDWMAHEAPTNEKLLIAHTNEDLRALTREMRGRYKKMGVLSDREITFKARQKDEMVPISVSVGERMKFLVNDKVLGVVNGDDFTVTKIRANSRYGGYDIHYKLDDGKEGRFNTNEWNAVNHSYAHTIHAAQGQGKEEIFHFGHAGMTDNASMLVAISRATKGQYRLYVEVEEYESMKNKLAQDRFSETVHKAGLVQVKETMAQYTQALKTESKQLQMDAKAESKPMQQTEDVLAYLEKSLAVTPRQPNERTRGRSTDNGLGY